jgi:trehalose utilization protein
MVAPGFASKILRRIATAALISVVASLVLWVQGADMAPVRVVVWDEQQPGQKQAYTNFLGNQIASYLMSRPGLTVKSVRLDDAEQGLSKANLDSCDVLVWWGHVRQKEITPETGREIVRRIKSGQLSLITLHSAHWSTPFVEAMNERAREDALKMLMPDERQTAMMLETNLYPNKYAAPKYDDRRTPSALFRKQPDGKIQVTLTLPNCCFPAFRADGKPSHVFTLMPDHPIARGIPRRFTIPQTEMYDEPFMCRHRTP